uniref:Ubiquitin carboxyl-terminal hydrolase n=1 Tax=Syphacia muris TaxID=451379 RepID=A0A0N5AT07_9BILA
MNNFKVSPSTSLHEGRSDDLFVNSNERTLDTTFYQVKWINFHGILYAIITQNENGPCPLLAIINVLLLRGQISLENNVTRVSEQHLLELVGDCILKLKPKDLEESNQRNYEQIIDDVLQLVQTLPKGLDVNPHFSGVFEYTPSCALFDALNIRLLHGWVVDPEQKQLVELLDGLGYNQVAERAISIGCDNNALLFQHFLETTASQLTVYGLSELRNELKDGEMAILFRNNHFHTLYKNQVDLYVLVTDQGYLDEPYVVWETLNCIDGNSSFVDAQFLCSNLSKHNVIQSEESKRAEQVFFLPNLVQNYLLALSIQEEERVKEEFEIKREGGQSYSDDGSQNSAFFEARGCNENIVMDGGNTRRNDYKRWVTYDVRE